MPPTGEAEPVSEPAPRRQYTHPKERLTGDEAHDTQVQARAERLDRILNGREEPPEVSFQQSLDTGASIPDVVASLQGTHAPRMIPDKLLQDPEVAQYTNEWREMVREKDGFLKVFKRAEEVRDDPKRLAALKVVAAHVLAATHPDNSGVAWEELNEETRVAVRLAETLNNVAIAAALRGKTTSGDPMDERMLARRGPQVVKHFESLAEDVDLPPVLRESYASIAKALHERLEGPSEEESDDEFTPMEAEHFESGEEEAVISLDRKDEPPMEHKIAKSAQELRDMGYARLKRQGEVQQDRVEDYYERLPYEQMVIFDDAVDQIQQVVDSDGGFGDEWHGYLRQILERYNQQPDSEAEARKMKFANNLADQLRYQELQFKSGLWAIPRETLKLSARISVSGWWKGIFRPKAAQREVEDARMMVVGAYREAISHLRQQPRLTKQQQLQMHALYFMAAMYESSTTQDVLDGQRDGVRTTYDRQRIEEEQDRPYWRRITKLVREGREVEKEAAREAEQEKAAREAREERERSKRVKVAKPAKRRDKPKPKKPKKKNPPIKRAA